jgi:hypothetical protein
VVLRPIHWQIITTNFEAKPGNQRFSSPPRVWSGCTRRHPTSRSSQILRTKSPTSSSLLVVARHVAFATYTSWDKQTRFSTPNNSIWVSSTKKRRIQIQTRTSQLLITHINQDTYHLVSHNITSTISLQKTPDLICAYVHQCAMCTGYAPLKEMATDNIVVKQ